MEFPDFDPDPLSMAIKALPTLLRVLLKILRHRKKSTKKENVKPPES